MDTLRILIAFSKAKINNIDVIFGRFSASDQEIIGLNIPMNDSLFMTLLNSQDHLLSHHAASFQVKLLFALHKKVFQAGA